MHIKHSYFLNTPKPLFHIISVTGLMFANSIAFASGPTAPNCPTVFPEFDCYAHYIACATIPAGMTVMLGSPYQGTGHIVPFGSKEIFYLSSEGELNNSGSDPVAVFPFWTNTGLQGLADINRDDLECSSSPPEPESPCDGGRCGG